MLQLFDLRIFITLCSAVKLKRFTINKRTHTLTTLLGSWITPYMKFLFDTILVYMLLAIA